MEILKKIKTSLMESIYDNPIKSMQKGLCISCKQTALENCYSDAGRKEYKISGLCEKCFDSLFDEDEK